MADQKKRISELPSSGTTTEGLYTIGVNAQNESVKVPLGQILGGYDTAAADAAAALNKATQAVNAASNAQTTANRAEGKAENAASAAADNVIDAVSATPDQSAVEVSVRQHGHTAVVGTIPAATTSLAGAMTAEDKAKLERHETLLGDTGKYDDTLEFAGILATATVEQSSTDKKSTDSDAQVFFVADIKRFVLGVRNAATYQAPQRVQGATDGVQQVSIGNIAAYERLTDMQVREMSQNMAEFGEYYTFYED